MKICVYGASSASLDQVFYDAARKVGRLLAKEGHTLIYGGGAYGIMGAVAEGANEENGNIIGVAPRIFDLPGILHQNCWMIYPDTMRERKAMMEKMADAFVVLPGGFGTYEEFFEVMVAKQLGLHSKAIVFLNTLQYFDPLQSLMEHMVKYNFAGRSCYEHFRMVAEPEEVLAVLKDYQPITGGVISKYKELGK